MGLICRYQGGNYYFFMISNDGYYVIGKFIGGQTLLLGQTEMQASDAIQIGTMNHLRADCIGNTLTFYINFTRSRLCDRIPTSPTAMSVCWQAPSRNPAWMCCSIILW